MRKKKQKHVARREEKTLKLIDTYSPSTHTELTDQGYKSSV